MNTSKKTVDFLVIGGGVAGLRAAIELAPRGSVTVLTKDKPSESSTGYAQGGIAAAMSDEDKVSIHYNDTINAGDGLCNEEAVRILVEEGPEFINELISWGAEFDKEGSKLDFTIEAAHTRKRILHSHGDSTGRELERVLVHKIMTFPSVTRYDFAFTKDLIIKDGRCIGAFVLRGDEFVSFFAKAVVLATGGAGELYSRTTNPSIATGDGMAIAYRAGAILEDMEFIQFHPTSFYSLSAPQFLLSESMRGEGAVLKNINKERFMPKYHKMADMAPRDAVARAIISEMVQTGAKHVYLDLSHLDDVFIKRRFPLIYSTCLKFGVDITGDLIPVSPAAHYIMGGVRTNLMGETNIKGLFAAGEVACTGVHGANRLASNSLLEGLVYGARTGKNTADYAEGIEMQDSGVPEPEVQESGSIDLDGIKKSLRRMMWEKAGIIRCGKSLSEAKTQLGEWNHIIKSDFQSRAELELKNMLTVSSLITDSAFLREGSIGAHHRSDFRDRGGNGQRHTACVKDKGVIWIYKEEKEDKICAK